MLEPPFVRSRKVRSKRCPIVQKCYRSNGHRKNNDGSDCLTTGSRGLYIPEPQAQFYATRKFLPRVIEAARQLYLRLGRMGYRVGGMRVTTFLLRRPLKDHGHGPSAGHGSGWQAHLDDLAVCGGSLVLEGSSALGL